MGLFSKKTPERTPKVEEPLEQLRGIKYVAGNGGKGSKANFFADEESVPVSVITRIERLCQDKPEQRHGFIFHSALEKRYGKFLESVERLGLSYQAALKQMVELKPIPKTHLGHRGSRIKKAAAVLARAICRRFKGNTEEEITSSFYELVQKEEFRSELKAIIQKLDADFGRNSLGFVKSNKRIGRPGLKGKAIRRK